MTQNSTAGAAKDAADQNFDYMFKLLIIGNSSVGKTSFVCHRFTSGFFLLSKYGLFFSSSSFAMQTIHLHLHLLVLWELILRLKQYFDMTNVSNYKSGIQLVKNVIVQSRVNSFKYHHLTEIFFIRSFLAAYYRGAMGFILMYDITNEESFNAVQDW